MPVSNCVNKETIIEQNGYQLVISFQGQNIVRNFEKLFENCLCFDYRYAWDKQQDIFMVNFDMIAPIQHAKADKDKERQM